MILATISQGNNFKLKIIMKTIFDIFKERAEKMKTRSRLAPNQLREKLRSNLKFQEIKKQMEIKMQKDLELKAKLESNLKSE